MSIYQGYFSFIIHGIEEKAGLPKRNLHEVPEYPARSVRASEAAKYSMQPRNPDGLSSPDFTVMSLY